jgi:hypothetical protein
MDKDRVTTKPQRLDILERLHHQVSDLLDLLRHEKKMPVRFRQRAERSMKSRAVAVLA